MASPIKAVSKTGELEDIPLPPPLSPAVPSNRYAGFVAGIFSGVTKLFVGHPYVFV